MAKYPTHRMLGRKSSHRQALLRNLVTSLFIHESISTTYPKAKEAQRLAEKCITLGKKGTNASRLRAEQILFVRCLSTRNLHNSDHQLQKPLENVPKLFGSLADRYKDRPGGYTRVLRIEPLKTDQAPSAILELVDGPKDLRFAMTAKTIAQCAKEDKDLTDLTLKNIKKVTQFREDGQAELERMVKSMKNTRI